jgi:hypothetical protein
MLYQLAKWLTPPVARVGADGVAIRGPGRRVFVSYRDVVNVEIYDGGVALKLASGRETRLPTRSSGDSQDREANAPTAALFNRIRDAMDAAEAGASALAASRALDREGRPFAAFREHLRALALGRHDYRTAGVSRDELAALIEDARAPAPRRLAAALALSAVDDPTLAARVRVAAEACADERLRAALEAAAAGALDEALFEELNTPRARD